MLPQQTVNTLKRVTIATGGLAILGIFAAAVVATRWDYAGRFHYREANMQVAALPSEDRIVFFGDSITNSWNLREFFPNRPYVNRGIDGQVTSQMVWRFQQDVVDLKPHSVVILAGINDVYFGTPVEKIEDNYKRMADEAIKNHIRIYFGSILPVHSYTPEAQRDNVVQRHPPEEIRMLNRWLRDYCGRVGAIYVDYWSQMVDDKGFLMRDLSRDGLHPNSEGYATMRSVLVRELSRGKLSSGVRAQ